MDIFNSRERKIVCIDNTDCDYMIRGINNHLLEVGKLYTVIDVDVYDWYTLITLKEFPDEQFNSVIFEEVNSENIN